MTTMTMTGYEMTMMTTMTIDDDNDDNDRR